MVEDKPTLPTGWSVPEKNRKSRILFRLKAAGFVLFAIVLITIFIAVGVGIGKYFDDVFVMSVAGIGLACVAIYIVSILCKKWGFGDGWS